ncbi:hypothetical protein ACI2OX_01830 [Bacillus sp. N9]
MFKTLRISMSFLIGNKVVNPQEIKSEMTRLVKAKAEKFYLKPKSIEQLKQITESDQNIFLWYDKASNELKDVILTKDIKDKNFALEKWINFIIKHRFPVEAVKDWTLKILLDIKVRVQALAYFKQNESAETLYDTFSKINSVYELEEWLKQYFHDVNEYVRSKPITNAEIAEARQYISDHLHRRITLDEVAQQLHLNQAILAVCLKRKWEKRLLDMSLIKR